LKANYSKLKNGLMLIIYCLVYDILLTHQYSKTIILCKFKIHLS